MNQVLKDTVYGKGKQKQVGFNEIKKFLLILYNNTDTQRERMIIKDML